MESQDRDVLDNLLDGALKQYSNVEPRPGLEGRVLTNLAVARSRSQFRRWAVSFALAGGVSVILVIGFMSLMHRPRRTVALAIHTPSAASAPSNRSDDAGAPTPKIPGSVAGLSVQRHKARTFAANAAAQSPPRLSQFPSPMPLSEQEQLLKQYVRAFPQEAIIIAKEQTLREQEFEKLLANQDSSGSTD